MRSRLSAVALWFATAAAATSLVWAGVGQIGNAARSDTALVVAPTSTSVAPPPEPPTTVAVTTTTPTATTDAPPATGPDRTDPTQPTTAPRRTTSVAPTTTAPGLPVGTPAATVTVPPITLPVTETYATVGGTTTIRFSATAVEVVLATPNPGFAARVEQRGATAVRVEFESRDHRSRVEASWSGGPTHDIRESD
jgi:hypothetical protein